METRDDDSTPPVRRRSVLRTRATPAPAAPSRAKNIPAAPPWAVVAIAALALGLGIAIGHGTSSSATAAGDTPPTIPLGPAPEEPTTTTQATQTPTRVAKTVILRQSGTGDKTTQGFITNSIWSVAYTYDCSNFGQAGLFSVNEVGGIDVIADVTGTKGADTSYEYDTGGHALTIITECNWTITVTDGDNG